MPFGLLMTRFCQEVSSSSNRNLYVSEWLLTTAFALCTRTYAAVSDGSGSVAVVAVVAKTRIVIAHCGDAEAILWRGGTCVRRLVAAAATPIPVIANTHVVQLFSCSQGCVGATGPPMSLSVAVLRVLVRARVSCRVLCVIRVKRPHFLTHHTLSCRWVH